MSDEEESLSPRIERSSSIWKRVSWNRSSSPNNYSDSDERTRLLSNSKNRSDDTEVSIEINKRPDDISGVDGDEDGDEDGSMNKTSVEKHLDETQTAVHNTIGVLLRRGEDINQLRSRADELQGAGSMFKKTAKKAYNEVWLDHLKKKSTLIAFYILFVLLAILMVLGIVQMIITAFYQIRNPPVASPPPRPPPSSPTTGVPGPGGGPGSGTGNGIQVTCNCYCPPTPPKTIFVNDLSNETDPKTWTTTPQIQVS